MTQLAMCRRLDDLRRLAAGELTDAESAAIESHVLACSDCARQLDSLQASDPLVQELQAACANPPAADRTTDALIERLLNTRLDGVPGTLLSEPMPARLGRYELVGLLGAGGMGVVWRGYDPCLQRDVAIKTPKLCGSDASCVAACDRFLREARAAAAVRHAHGCPIYDIGAEHGRPFVVMALVEGESLADRLRRQRRFDEPREATALVAAVADALAVVHARHLVHCDLKPGNILLDRAGQPFLTDFGLACAADQAPPAANDPLVGTPAYMAPEQAMPALGPVGPWSDQYSLAVVLYQMLTGRLPFEGPVADLLWQIRSQPVPAPSQHCTDLDAALERVLMKALSRQPRDRYASVAEFAAALRVWNAAK